MRILVTGSRDWDDRTTMLRALIEHAKGATTIVHGACPTGADALADEIASELGTWAVERYPADWERYGKGAGPVRNKRMVLLGADVCLAFINNGSKGATHCADAAEAWGIPTIRYEAKS